MSEALIVDTSLYEADLRKANLSKSFFTGAYLRKANCTEANLQGANLVFADLNEADFSGADFSGAKLFWDDLGEIEFGQTRRIVDELNRENYEVDLFLKDTDLRGVKGLTKEQLAACKAKGAIIDEDLIDSSSQSTSAPSSPSQSNDLQASLAPSAQENTPSSDPDGSNTASSQQEPES